MSRVVLIPVLLFVVGGVSAQKGNPPKPQPVQIQCPIGTTHKVKIKDAMAAKLFSDHKGRRFFFCCGGCKRKFDQNPAKFEKQPSLPTPKS